MSAKKAGTKPKRKKKTAQKTPAGTGGQSHTAIPQLAKRITGTCFVIMPIGDQALPDGRTISAKELRDRFDHIIRDAIRTAAPDVEVTRADDVARPGSITSDIYTRLMHSDFVVADISFANPNVFYELGIRHACRPGTILIRADDDSPVPFDIRSARHVTYSTGPGGWKKLGEELRSHFEWITANPRELDNDFLSQAKLIGFQFPAFGPREVQKQKEFSETMASVLAAPGIGELFLNSIRGGSLDQDELMKRLFSSPEALTSIIRLVVANGGKFQPPF